MSKFNNLQTIKTQLSLIHLSISSLQCYYEELHDLLNTSKAKFNVIGITESHLKKGISYKIIKLNILQQSVKKVGLYYTSLQI